VAGAGQNASELSVGLFVHACSDARLSASLHISGAIAHPALPVASWSSKFRQALRSQNSFCLDRFVVFSVNELVAARDNVYCRQPQTAVDSIDVINFPERPVLKLDHAAIVHYGIDPMMAFALCAAYVASSARFVQVSYYRSGSSLPP
jgi:hypothetical protein